MKSDGSGERVRYRASVGQARVAVGGIDAPGNSKVPFKCPFGRSASRTFFVDGSTRTAALTNSVRGAAGVSDVAPVAATARLIAQGMMRDVVRRARARQLNLQTRAFIC